MDSEEEKHHMNLIKCKIKAAKEMTKLWAKKKKKINEFVKYGINKILKIKNDEWNKQRIE